MKLNEKEIEQIKSLISKRGFTYTDLQLEIIDHVASAIEEKMEKDPNLDLQQAFQEVHSSFGPLGFLPFEEAITKKHDRQLFHNAVNVIKDLIFSFKVFIPLLFGIILYQMAAFDKALFEQFMKVGLMSFFGLSLPATVFLFIKKKHLRNYLAFRQACRFLPAYAYVILQLWNLVLSGINPLLSVPIVLMIFIVYTAILQGAHKMIKRTEKLDCLYRA